MPAAQQALADQLVDRRAQRRARHAEVGREPALGRDRVADVQLVEQREQLVAHVRLLGAPGAAGRCATISLMSPRCRPPRRRAAHYRVVKKWSRPISTTWRVRRRARGAGCRRRPRARRARAAASVSLASITIASAMSSSAAASAVRAAASSQPVAAMADARRAVAQLVVRDAHRGHQVAERAAAADHQRGRERVQHELLRGAGLQARGAGDHLGADRDLDGEVGAPRRARSPWCRRSRRSARPPAASTAPSAYGVRPLAETATTTSSRRGASARTSAAPAVRVVLRGGLRGRAGRVLGAGDERDDRVGHGERRPPLASRRRTRASRPSRRRRRRRARPAVEALRGGVGERGDRRLGRLDRGDHLAVAAHDRARRRRPSDAGRGRASAAARPSVSSPPSGSLIARAGRRGPGGAPAPRGCRARCCRR